MSQTRDQSISTSNSGGAARQRGARPPLGPTSSLIHMTVQPCQPSVVWKNSGASVVNVAGGVVCPPSPIQTRGLRRLPGPKVGKSSMRSRMAPLPEKSWMLPDRDVTRRLSM